MKDQEFTLVDAGQPVSQIAMLPASERHQLLEEWNATETAYPRDKRVHALFEEQVAGDPEAVALVFEGETLSYGELNARAIRLAHHLRGLGVGPDERVAICVERSFGMVVGLLAILKAGGCYVPLDPAYPMERLGFMLGDSAPKVVLTHGAARDALEAALSGTGLACPVLDLDETAVVERACNQPRSRSGRAEQPPSRLYHLHLGLDRYPQGRHGRTSQCGRPDRLAPRGLWFEQRRYLLECRQSEL